MGGGWCKERGDVACFLLQFHCFHFTSLPLLPFCVGWWVSGCLVNALVWCSLLRQKGDEDGVKARLLGLLCSCLCGETRQFEGVLEQQEAWSHGSVLLACLEWGGWWLVVMVVLLLCPVTMGVSEK